MKFTMNYNTVYAFATQRNATQRNATQRISQLYLLTNNLNFYILQIFKAFNFLSAEFLLQKFNINLVKTFLTSITFDNLSRKIKNPCFVINNLSKRRNSMKNSKKLFLIVLSVLVVAFVSCKDKGTDPAPTTFKVSSIVGTWTSAVDSTSTFTVTDTGNITVTTSSGSPSLVITSWDADKDKEVTQYAVTLSGNIGSQSVSFTFTFKSANSCDLSMEGQAGVEPFTK